MKDRIKPIDVSILSTYMGRSLTIVVTAAVVGIAVSAYLAGGGPERNTISVCVPAGSSAIAAMRTYEPLRALLSKVTRRPADLVACEGVWPAGCDLYIMSTHAYFADAAELGLTALHELLSGDGAQERAILVARGPDREIDLADLEPEEVAFASPSSVNGFWVQMSLLARYGFNEPAGRLRFEGAGGSRVILGVLHGAYRLGACTMGELSAMTDRGVIRAGELEVVEQEDALPELVIAAPRGQADYYRKQLQSIEARFKSSSGLVVLDPEIQLLRAYGIQGLRLAAPSRLERAQQLFERYGKGF